jgi:hypothetical protein
VGREESSEGDPWKTWKKLEEAEWSLVGLTAIWEVCQDTSRNFQREVMASAVYESEPSGSRLSRLRRQLQELRSLQRPSQLTVGIADLAGGTRSRRAACQQRHSCRGVLQDEVAVRFAVPLPRGTRRV